jgi:hypothetical protein
MVAHFAMMEQVHDDLKWMLDPGADLLTGSLERGHLVFQRAVLHYRDFRVGRLAQYQSPVRSHQAWLVNLPEH